MKPSKDQSYLATIKRNHRIHTNVEPEKQELNEYKIFKHLRALKNTNRLSGIKTLQSYSVAEHCYYTGLLFEAIANHEKINITERELHYVFRHDIIETITGDVLLPVKIHSDTTRSRWEAIENEIVCNKYPYLKSYLDEYMPLLFSEESWNLFKACDLYELYLFCLEEVQLGNNNDGIISVIRNCCCLLPEFKINYITNKLK